MSASAPAIAADAGAIAHPAASCDETAVRGVLRHHAAAVTIVTAGDPPVGLCATSFTSVSLAPPLVSFCIGTTRSCWPTLRQAPWLMVHLLEESQADLADRFGRHGRMRFGPETAWHRGAFGLPTLDDVLAWLVIEPSHRMALSDHVLVVGRVISAVRASGRRPLLYHDGRFTGLTP